MYNAWSIYFRLDPTILTWLSQERRMGFKTR